MRLLSITSIAVAVAIASSACMAADWVPKDKVDGVQLYAKQSDENPSFQSFKGVVKVNASMKQVLAAVLVRETFPEWVFNMKEDRTLTEDNADQSYCYMWIKGVWPTDDRDAVARVTVNQDPQTLAVKVVAQSAEQNRVPPQKGRVRMAYLYSGFTVIPVSADVTEVQLEGYADPAGNIPTFLTNKVASDLPAKTLAALKARLEAGKVDVGALETVPFAKLSMQKIKLPQGQGDRVSSSQPMH